VSVVASSTGTEVFVTGQVDTSMGGSGYATVAYNAATGGQLWARQYGGPANWYAAPRSMTISRTGQTVFVTGYAHLTKSRVAYATVAYNAATGAQLWARRYIAPGGRNGDAAAIGVSPSGRTVFVTGETYVTPPRETYTTVGYNAVTGAQLWARHYNASAIDATAALAVSPRGDGVRRRCRLRRVQLRLLLRHDCLPRLTCAPPVTLELISCAQPLTNRCTGSAIRVSALARWSCCCTATRCGATAGLIADTWIACASLRPPMAKVLSAAAPR
jgi:hypothetical protein